MNQKTWQVRFKVVKVISTVMEHDDTEIQATAHSIFRERRLYECNSYVQSSSVRRTSNTSHWSGNETTLQQRAELGDTDAQCRLGYCYYQGEGVTQSYTKAVKWFRKAAEQGDAGAQTTLGMCLSPSPSSVAALLGIAGGVYALAVAEGTAALVFLRKYGPTNSEHPEVQGIKPALQESVYDKISVAPKAYAESSFYVE